MSEVTEVTIASPNGQSVTLDGDAFKRLDKAIKELDGKDTKKKKGPVPVDVIESKVFKQFAKKFDEKYAKEMLEKGDDELKLVLAENLLRRDELKGKLKDNKEYLKAKDIVQTMEGGMKSTMIESDMAAKLAKAILKARR